jgi:energy-coupling factor transport system permease protein
MRSSFGKYLPLNSIIHKLDPRIKLISFFLLIIGTFLNIGIGYGILLGIIIGLFLLSRLSFLTLINLFQPVLFIFIIFLILQGFIDPSRDKDDLFY